MIKQLPTSARKINIAANREPKVAPLLVADVANINVPVATPLFRCCDRCKAAAML